MIERFRIILPVMILLLVPALGWGVQDGFVETFLHRFEEVALDSTSRILLLSLIASATLVSEDLTCIGAGLLAAKGVISPVEAVVASGLGIYIGDLMLYFTGYLIGVTALHHVPLKWFVSEQRVRQGKTLFERRGLALVFTSRFIPGTRTVTFLAAGLARVHLVRLLFIFAAAVLIWTPVLVLGAMLIGRQMVRYVEVYSYYALPVFLLLLFGLFLLTRLIVPLFTWRGRRLLLGKWRRLTRWEFWPFYITNSVVFLYVLILGCFKYRQPTLFTIVNPAIKPDSGFIGESKSAILDGLPREAVGRWQLVSGSLATAEKQVIISSFMNRHELAYPIVLKPDVGQRGQGVGICRNEAEISQWLADVSGDFIVMEFLEGDEFGVFYYRLPQAQRGTIFSITRKKLLYVEGDGKRTLEELILADDRAVCLAPTFMNELQSELLDIVPQGEKRQLVRVGTHCRGSLFLSGNELTSPELLRSVEDIVGSYEGFYFGRFDIKVKNDKDLKDGRNLRVVELNGVTSEATHIYDPRNSLIYAWRTLIKQWSIAFEIAAVNRKRGCQPMSVSAFIRHWVKAG